MMSSGWPNPKLHVIANVIFFVNCSSPFMLRRRCKVGSHVESFGRVFLTDHLQWVTNAAKIKT